MLIISTTTTSSNQIKRHLRLTRQIFMHRIHIFLFLNVKYLFIAAVNLVAPFYIAHSYSVCSLSFRIQNYAKYFFKHTNFVFLRNIER